LNLTFRQLYVVHMAERKSEDPKILSLIFAKLHTIRSKATLKDVDLICSAAEIIFLARNIILSICVFGEYTTAFQITRIGKLKAQIRRIATDLSLLKSMLQSPTKNFSYDELNLSINTTAGNIFQFKIDFAKWFTSSNYEQKKLERLKQMDHV